MIFIEETKVIVQIKKDFTDIIIIQFNGSNPFPSSNLINFKPELFLEVQEGLGIDYCRYVFEVEPEIENLENEYRIDHD